jgi:hypothetical protein
MKMQKGALKFGFGGTFGVISIRRKLTFPLERVIWHWQNATPHFVKTFLFHNRTSKLVPAFSGLALNLAAR